MSKTFFGKWLAAKRKAKGLTQPEVAKVLGMSRGNYGHIETGRRKDPLTFEQHNALVRLLDVDGLELITKQGYDVRCPGFRNQEEIQLLERFRLADPATQRFVLRGLE